MLTKSRPVQQFDLPSGRSLGSHYQIVDFLGRGYEGEVYKVVESYTGIERAAKIFFPQRNPRGRALLRYARKMNKLKHLPIIVQYHHLDMAQVRGQKVAFMISDFVEGELLSRFVEHQPGKRLRSFEALYLLRTLANGVAPIHQLGEYHGDIHTDNIIISRRGAGFRIKLLDFFDLGRPTRQRIQDDMVDLVHVLYEIIGGQPRYGKAGPEIKRIVCGLKRSLIARRFRSAGELRQAIDSLRWD
ncbi:MAG TPA: protein kinase [Myxococcota bacterium]|nr:protein kinase [Myxococcota bacterium]